MPTALIADDEPHLAVHLRDALAVAWPELDVQHLVSDGIEAAERIAGASPHVAFLDIRMPGLTGLEVAAGIESRTRVVFVTAYDGFAVEAFERHAVDYLLKPVSAARLAVTVGRLKGLLAAPSRDDDTLATLLRRLESGSTTDAATAGAAPLRRIRAGSGDVVHLIDVADVLFFEADTKYTVVHTATGAEHLIRMPIAELATSLDAERFAQIHRATIVNLDRIAGTRRDATSRLFLRLHGEARELPVSRAYVHLFKAM